MDYWFKFDVRKLQEELAQKEAENACGERGRIGNTYKGQGQEQGQVYSHGQESREVSASRSFERVK